MKKIEESKKTGKQRRWEYRANFNSSIKHPRGVFSAAMTKEIRITIEKTYFFKSSGVESFSLDGDESKEDEKQEEPRKPCCCIVM